MISTFKEDQKLPTSVTPETCNIKDTNDSADLNSEASWAVPGKKLRLLNWIFSFQNSFRRKILMIDRAYYVRGHMWTQKMQTLSTRNYLKSARNQLVFACHGYFLKKSPLTNWMFSHENLWRKIKINVSQLNLKKIDASQSLKNWCQSNHFILTKHIYFPI